MENSVMNEILDASKKFRSQPNKEYLSQVSSHLSTHYHRFMIRQILSKAVSSLDHFPSISQIEEIHDELKLKEAQTKAWVEMKNKPTEKKWVSTQCPGISPAVEGLILNYKQRGYPSPFGLKHCKITEAEFLDVLYEWENGRIHPSAKREKKPLGACL